MFGDNNPLGNFFLGLAGNDILNGGVGWDEVGYHRDARYGGLSGVSVDFILGTATDGFGDTDTLIGIESARGTDFIDTFIGSSNWEAFQGLEGAENFFGGAGNDEAAYYNDFRHGGSSGVYVDLASNFAIDGFGTIDALSSI